MPYVIHRLGNGKFSVINVETGQAKSKHTSRAKAEAQIRLLNSKEIRLRAGHGSRVKPGYR